MPTSNNRARQLDDEDVLRAFRDEFFLLPGAIYMDGNSLGRCDGYPSPGDPAFSSARDFASPSRGVPASPLSGAGAFSTPEAAASAAPGIAAFTP